MSLEHWQSNELKLDSDRPSLCFASLAQDVQDVQLPGQFAYNYPMADLQIMLPYGSPAQTPYGVPHDFSRGQDYRAPQQFTYDHRFGMPHSSPHYPGHRTDYRQTMPYAAHHGSHLPQFRFDYGPNAPSFTYRPNIRFVHDQQGNTYVPCFYHHRTAQGHTETHYWMQQVTGEHDMPGIIAWNGLPPAKFRDWARRYSGRTAPPVNPEVFMT